MPPLSERDLLAIAALLDMRGIGASPASLQFSGANDSHLASQVSKVLLLMRTHHVTISDKISIVLVTTFFSANLAALSMRRLGTRRGRCQPSVMDRHAAEGCCLSLACWRA